MPREPWFTDELFTFLQQLKKNNDREWFARNKPRYEAVVKAPLLRFIADFRDPLHEISPHFRAEPRANGGSMFRIYRDTRFSKDKTPYKTHAAAQFRHETGKDAHCPGFYLHLEPGNCFAGVGLWHPDNPTLGKIRDAIVDNPREWKKVSQGKRFGGNWELRGDALKRPPRGFDPEHEHVEDLKRKDFIALHPLTQAQVTSPDFMQTWLGTLRPAIPYMRFLTEACDAAF